MDGSESKLRELETNLHRELSTVCRKYVRELGIVSVLGMLEMVKQETLELERVTKKEINPNSNENMF